MTETAPGKRKPSTVLGARHGLSRARGEGAPVLFFCNWQSDLCRICGGGRQFPNWRGRGPG